MSSESGSSDPFNSEQMLSKYQREDSGKISLPKEIRLEKKKKLSSRTMAKI